VKLLALDTSSTACSVALQLGDRTCERHEEQPREHTRLLLPMIRSVLDQGEIELSDLDAIVLGNGPGSFIGMRIAASVAQGLAFGAALGIVPVSSMAAVAARALAESAAQEIVVTQDARMHEVYLGIYRRGPDGLPEPGEPERLHGMTVIDELGESGREQRLGAGFGWQRYPELFAANQDRIAELLDLAHPRAVDLLALGARSLAGGEILQPEEVTPAYLRQKVAEKPSN
jgi:tRNA threonylcarbamoyladenosine biosynthesis protein TsaB